MNIFPQWFIQLASRVLPASLKSWLKSVLTSEAVVPVSALNLISWEAFVDQKNVIRQLDRFIAVYDSLGTDQKEQLSLSVFNSISLSPSSAILLETEYCQNMYGDHPFYLQVRAAREYGLGNIDQAFSCLCKVELNHPSPFNAGLASRCLMRPSGREQEVISFLLQRVKRWPTDCTLQLNLATAFFCVGDIKKANLHLGAVLREWREGLLPYSANIQALSDELARALAQKTIYRKFWFDDESYREELIRSHWEPYYSWMKAHPEHLNFGWLKNTYKNIAIDQIKEAHTLPCEFINFGVMCGQADYEVANLFPEIKFTGVDRQNNTAVLNDKAYKSDNLSFVASEIEDYLEALPSDGKPRALFHGRTATLCYPEKIKNLYKLCAEKVITSISLFENYSVSHKYYKFMSFDEFLED
ncbi:hypothetical protein OAD74_08925 [Alphaproteobacteria bacterium]|nr:hypothetical protein [Alphaproteobacteria bacterium]